MKQKGWYLNVTCPKCRFRCFRSTHLECVCGATNEYQFFQLSESDSEALAFEQQKIWRKKIELKTDSKYDRENKEWVKNDPKIHRLFL